MLPRINIAYVKDNFLFSIIFENGEKGIFDLKPFLNIGKFQELSINNNYKRFIIDDGVITWYNDLDIAPDTVYLNSIIDVNLKHLE